MIDEKITLSVLIITYNHEKFIAQAIESALGQKTNFDYEIVIGEDYSTDKTREIVKEYKTKFPKKITLLLPDKNLGMMKNFVNTLHSCNGKYIALLEGDDYWIDPYKLQKQVNFLEANPDYGMVFTDYNILYEKSKPVLIKSRNKYFYGRKKIPAGNIFENVLISNFIRTLTVCVRKDILSEILDSGLLLNQDWMQGDKPLWLEISHRTMIGYIAEPTANYRNAVTGISRQGGMSKAFNFGLSDLNIKLHFIEKYGCSEKTKKIIKKRYYHYLINNCLQSANNKEAKKIKIEMKKDGYFDLMARIKFLFINNRLMSTITIFLIKLRRDLIPLFNFRIPKWIKVKLLDF